MNKVVFAIGSPKPKKSASLSFTQAFETRFEQKGWETTTTHIKPAYGHPEQMNKLFKIVASSDLVFLSFPVYVDTLPGPVLNFLETWEAEISKDPNTFATGKRLVVLAQCGFPQAKHCDVAIEVCKLFCAKTGVVWAGALAFGMGGAIETVSVEKSMIAKYIPKIDLSVQALAQGGTVPEDSTVAFAQQLVPTWLYPIAGRISWKRWARKEGCKESLKLKRYSQ